MQYKEPSIFVKVLIESISFYQVYLKGIFCENKTVTVHISIIACVVNSAQIFFGMLENKIQQHGILMGAREGKIGKKKKILLPFVYRNYIKFLD